ncbi:MAG: hypothetical protein WC558_11180 [Patulibacter sp.]
MGFKVFDDGTGVDEPVGASESASESASEVSVWRRPTTSIATAIALAVGVTAGFLTAPQGGVAESGSPVALSSAAGTPATRPAADEAPVATAPTEEAPAEDAPAEAETAAPTTPGDEDVPVDPVAGPEPTDAPLPPAEDVAPTPVDADPAPAATTTTTSKAKSKTPAKKTRKAGPDTAAASGLPKIDRIWVIGIGTPVPVDGDYVGDVLLPRATELPKYAPVATDPALGAAALTDGLDALTAALKAPSDRPALSYVATDPALDAAGLDAQLKQLVEPIRRSAAFKKAGLIAIVPTASDPTAPAGALILSPFAAGSTSVAKDYGPYSLLRTFAELLDLEPLGEAAGPGVKALGPDVLTPKD